MWSSQHSAWQEGSLSEWQLWLALLPPHTLFRPEAAGLGMRDMCFRWRMSDECQEVNTGPRLALRTPRCPLCLLFFLVLQPSVCSCSLPLFLYLLFIISHELVQEGSQPGLLFSLSLQAAPCPASWAAWSVGGGGPGEPLALSLAFCRLWPPAGRKPHLSALSSQCLEPAPALRAELDTPFSKPRAKERRGLRV